MAADGLGDDADQDAVDAARTLVTTAQTAVDALGADDQARLSSQVASANTMVTAAQTSLNNAAMVAANTKAAITKETAITEEAGEKGADDAGLGGSVATVDDVYSFTIERDRTAPRSRSTTTRWRR